MPLADLDFRASLLVLAAFPVVLFYVIYAAVAISRRPPAPSEGPATMELRDEPPAVVNLLGNGFMITPEAVPATLLDLAARGHVSIEEIAPGQAICRLKPVSDAGLQPYERKVLDHVRSRAIDGVVPAAALTTGPQAASRGWWRDFAKTVITDSQVRGLSRNFWDGGVLTTLGLLALAPIPLLWLAAGGDKTDVAWQPAGWFAVFDAVGMVGAMILAGAASASLRQRETPLGLHVAGRWIGVRNHLAANEVLPTVPASAVVIWERHLAYAAALGLARAAVEALPLGTEDDHHAWSAFGGNWRQVHVRYPRPFLRPGWGRSPGGAVAMGLLAVGFSLGVLYVLFRVGRPETGDLLSSEWETWIYRVQVAIGVLAALLGLRAVYQVVVAIGDFWLRDVVVGEVVRKRKFRVASNNDRPVYRHYVAIDNGTRRRIPAWVVRPLYYDHVVQHGTARAVVTRSLGYVRELDPAPSAPPAAGGGPVGQVPWVSRERGTIP